MSQANATGEVRITTKQRLYIFAITLVLTAIIVLGIGLGL